MIANPARRHQGGGGDQVRRPGEAAESSGRGQGHRQGHDVLLPE